MTDSAEANGKQDGRELESSDSVESALTSMERELKGLTDLVTSEGEDSVLLAETVEDFDVEQAPLTDDELASALASEADQLPEKPAAVDEANVAPREEMLDSTPDEAVEEVAEQVVAEAETADEVAAGQAADSMVAELAEETSSVAEVETATGDESEALAETETATAATAEEVGEIEEVPDFPTVDMETETPAVADLGVDAQHIEAAPETLNTPVAGAPDLEPIADMLARAESEADAVAEAAINIEDFGAASTTEAAPPLSTKAIMAALQNVAADEHAEEFVDSSVTSAASVEAAAEIVDTADMAPKSQMKTVVIDCDALDAAAADNSPAQPYRGGLSDVESDQVRIVAEAAPARPSFATHPTPPSSASGSTTRSPRRAPSDRTLSKRPRSGRTASGQVEAAIQGLADFLLDDVSQMWGDAREGLEGLVADLDEAKHVKEELDALYREMQAMRDDLNASRRESRQLHTQIQNLRDDAARARQRADAAACDAQAAADRAVAAAREAELAARLDRGV